MRFVVTLVVFANAFLLFLVEPMVARLLLPAFGGAPSVWTTSMLFFQLALLAGYGYAHAVRTMPSRVQTITHILFLAFGLITMPIALPVGTGASSATNPTFGLLWALVKMIGPSFIALSAGSSILQQWFARTDDNHANDPYFLYAASNIGSLLALLSYPFLVEPRWGVSEQALLYRAAYVGLIVMFVICGIVLLRRNAEPSRNEAEGDAPESVDALARLQRETASQSQVRWRWIFLAAVPSSLMLGTTNYLSSNVAPIPLLWVVPLSLYLISFIFAFSRRTFVPARMLSRVLPLIVTPLAVLIIMEATEPMLLIAGLNLAAMFVAAWMCHARLAESRPGTARLTEFFFYVALGGVVGGLFNSLVAPFVFSSYAEYPIALVAACILRLPHKPDPDANQSQFRLDALWPVGISFLTILIVIATRIAGMEPSPLRTSILVGLPCVLAFFAVDRPWRFGLSMGAVFLWSNMLHTSSDGAVIRTERSFFGVHRVVSTLQGRFHRLVHGNTIHGMQDRDHPGVPLTYYYPTGPIGKVFAAIQGDSTKNNVALVGLGAGSLAAYGRAGQTFTYFELDPVVIKLAKDRELFTFLSDSKANIQTVTGDARLTLQQSRGNFGLIVLDAFSSDSIPVHLLTKEAIEMYLSKLAPGGILAFHISNRYLDLEPILGVAANQLRLQAAVYLDGPLEAEREAGKTQSHWVIMSRTEHDIAKILSADRTWGEIEVPPGTRGWTDDYSNVVQAFKPNGE